MKNSDREKILRCYPVLQELPDDLFKRIEQEAKLIEAPAGTQLFDEGTPCTHFPLLVDGVIKAMKIGPDGHEILLYRLKESDRRGAKLYSGDICFRTGIRVRLSESPTAHGAALDCAVDQGISSWYAAWAEAYHRGRGSMVAPRWCACSKVRRRWSACRGTPERTAISHVQAAGFRR